MLEGIRPNQIATGVTAIHYQSPPRDGTERKMDIPRRNQLQLLSVGETAIRYAIQVVQLMGADPLLTDAVNLLQEAKEKVSDYVDRK